MRRRSEIATAKGIPLQDAAHKICTKFGDIKQTNFGICYGFFSFVVSPSLSLSRLFGQLAKFAANSVESFSSFHSTQSK